MTARRSIVASMRYLLVVTAAALFGSISTGGHSGAAEQSARFGDSTWVAPYPVAILGGDPASNGPRIAEPDRNRTAETVLRFPFRVAASPFRLLARGAENALPSKAAPPRMVAKEDGSGGGGVEAAGFHIPFIPTLKYSKTAGLAFGFQAMPPRAGIWSASVGGSLSLRDHRRASLKQKIGGRAPIALRINSGYKYGPNIRFHGLGNQAGEAAAIYLEEEGEVDAFAVIGRNSKRQFQLIGGFSSISARRGYEELPHLEDVFLPSEVPFFLEKSEILSYGAGFDLAALDNPYSPSRGLHARTEVREMHGVRDTDLEYLQWHLEGRGYLPLGNNRRVFALRAVHQGVEPQDGTRAVPFYRLPRSAGVTHFSAYQSGRFRDQQLILAHAEYRWLAWDYLWALAFAQWGEVAPELGAFRLSEGHESYGLGLRFAFQDFVAFRVELARGSEGLGIRLGGGDF